MSNKRKLSKMVLEMKFMKRSKLQQEKHDEANENIDVLTDQRMKGERQSYFIIERNWEIIENLRCSRLNYGMSTKKSSNSSSAAQVSKDVSHDDNNDEDNYVELPKAKHIRYNQNDDD